MRVLRSRFPDIDDLARLLVEHRVVVDERIVTNPDALVRRDAPIRLVPSRRLRGDDKLSLALEAFRLDVHGLVTVDVGAAAGGFTSALLRAGARRVYAVDTGYGQLRGSLRADARVVNLERTNVADLAPSSIPDRVDLVTMDLSYTSIGEAIGALDMLRLAETVRLIALVKPTFELAAGRLVADRVAVEAAIDAAVGAIERARWRCEATTLPTITGRRGAVESFVLASRTTAATAPRRQPGPRR